MLKQMAAEIDSKVFRFPYQLKGKDFILQQWDNNQPVILADEMGLGKTIQAIDAIDSQITKSNIDTPCVVIVVPSNTMIDQWEFEITNSKLKDTLPCILKLKDKDDLDGLMDINPNLLITSYDIVTELESNRRESDREKRFKVAHSGEQFESTKHFGWFKKLNIDFLVFDEGHEEKSLQAMNCDSTQSLSARFKLTLTGTPIVRSAHDLLVQLFVGSNDEVIRQSVGKDSDARKAFIDASKASGEIQALLSGASIIAPFNGLDEQSYETRATWALSKFAYHSTKPLNRMLTAFGYLYELYWNYIKLRDRTSVESEFLQEGVPEELRCQHTVERNELDLEVDTAVLDESFDSVSMNNAGFRTLMHVTGKQNKRKREDAFGKSKLRTASDDFMRSHKLKVLCDYLTQRENPCVIYTKTKKSVDAISKEISGKGFLVATNVEGFKNLIAENEVSGNPVLLVINEFQGLNLGMAQELIIIDEPESYALRKQLEGRLNRFKQVHDKIIFTSFPPQSMWEKWIYSTQQTQGEIIRLLLSRESFEIDEESTSLEDEQEKRKKVVAFSFLVKTMAEIIRNASGEIPANNLLKQFNEQQLSKALAKELTKPTKNDSSSDQTSGEQSTSVASSSQPVPYHLDEIDWSDLFNDGASSGSFGHFGDLGPFDDLGPLDDLGIFDL